MTTQPDAFDSADYYDCRDSDEYTYGTFEECIEEFFDAYHEPGESIAASIAKHTPLTVEAYARTPVPDDWVESVAARLLESIDEQWQDEYGDPDGTNYAPTPDLEAVARQLVRDVLAAREVWRCEKVAERTYDAAQVEALLRKQCPGWFEEGVEVSP